MKKFYIISGVVLLILVFTNPSTTDFKTYLLAKGFRTEVVRVLPYGREYNFLFFSIYASNFPIEKYHTVEYDIKDSQRVYFIPKKDSSNYDKKIHSKFDWTSFVYFLSNILNIQTSIYKINDGIPPMYFVGLDEVYKINDTATYAVPDEEVSTFLNVYPQAQYLKNPNTAANDTIDWSKYLDPIIPKSELLKFIRTDFRYKKLADSEIINKLSTDSTWVTKILKGALKPTKYNFSNSFIYYYKDYNKYLTQARLGKIMENGNFKEVSDFLMSNFPHKGVGDLRRFYYNVKYSVIKKYKNEPYEITKEKYVGVLKNFYGLGN